MNCKKVALIGPRSWALWNINYFLKQKLSERGYDAKIVEWDNYYKTQEALDWCDVFISEVSTFNSMSEEHKSKGMFCWHHLANIELIPLSNENKCRHFTSLIEVDKEYEDHFFAINEKVAQSVNDYYGITPGLLPIGTDKDFWHKRNISSISTIGHVSHPSPSTDYDTVKRIDMFWDIVNCSEYEGKQLHGKSMLCGSYIYKDVDAVVCTSTHEGNPMALLECAMIKIPFISTNVGIVPDIKSVRTFSTIEEARDILDDLNSSPEKLKKYVDDVYNEVLSSNDWDMLISKYYISAIDKISLKKQIL